MLARLGQYDEAAVLDGQLLSRRPLLIRPADPFVTVACRIPQKQSDPFFISELSNVPLNKNTMMGIVSPYF